MSDTRFKAGYVVEDNNQNKPVKTLTQALTNLANCDPCGCDPKLGYWTQMDIADGTLQIVVIRSGTLEVYPWDADHLTWLKEMCDYRENGGQAPSPPDPQ